MIRAKQGSDEKGIQHYTFGLEENQHKTDLFSKTGFDRSIF